MSAQILITALITVLILLVEHWLPWRAILGRDLPRMPSYLAGVLAIALPLTVLYWRWASCPPDWPFAHLVALWVVIILAGMAVQGAYLFDNFVAGRAELRDLREILKLKEEQDHEPPESEIR